MTPDKWHMTCDMWQMKCVISYNGLGVMMFWRYFHKGWMSHLINEWVNEFFKFWQNKNSVHLYFRLFWQTLCSKAVLQSALWLINWLTCWLINENIFKTLTFPNRKSYGLDHFKDCSLPLPHKSCVMCHISHVKCQMSHVKCRMSHVKCPM